MGNKPLNRFDLKLINLLLKNCRTNINRLAKQLKCSNQKVTYHMQQLENEGIIQKYCTLINPYSLGMNFYALISLKVDTTTHNQVYEQIKYLKETSAVNKITGPYDFNLMASFRTAKELDDFTNKTLAAIPGIQASYTQLFTQQFYYGKQVSGKIFHPHRKARKPPLLDKTDYFILETLRNKARMKLQDIANNTSLSRQTIANRVQRLEKHDVIRGYSIITNPVKCGNQVNAYILIKSIPNKTASVLNHLKNTKEIIWISGMTGEYNFHLYISTQDIFTLNQLLSEKINIIPGINTVETQMILDHHYKTLL